MPKGEDDERAEKRGRDPALDQETRQPRCRHESDKVTAGRAQEVDETGCPEGKDRKTCKTLCQVEKDRGCAALAPQKRARENDGESLQGHGHRSEGKRYGHLRGHGYDEGEPRDQACIIDAGGNAFVRPQDQGKNGGRHVNLLLREASGE